MASREIREMINTLIKNNKVKNEISEQRAVLTGDFNKIECFDFDETEAFTADDELKT